MRLCHPGSTRDQEEGGSATQETTVELAEHVLVSKTVVKVENLKRLEGNTKVIEAPKKC